MMTPQSLPTTLSKPFDSLALLALPLAFALALAALTSFPRIHDHWALAASFAGACAFLFAWLAILWIQARRRERSLELEISLRPQHYLQAVAHTMIFVYWGLYWTGIQDAALLIVAQIMFAYVFDMLLAWSRRNTYLLGFGPFPIIYSTNLFLRFHDDWFFLQFLMVAVGFLAKEMIRWERDGRRVHIFNPSSFPLALFSLALIVTGATHISWGEEIATLLNQPPQIFLFIFLVSLPGQFLFRVATMTLPAVLTTYLFSLAYLKITGTYFFVDSNIPIAVFLGMHLLFTDPSTSPRTELGRIIFGVIYGSTVVGLYWLLGWLDAPTFYDKLLQVPVMNLMVRGIDRVAQSTVLAWLNPERLGSGLKAKQRGFAYASLWVAVFGFMAATNGVGDYHPGDAVPFWENVCREERTNGCKNFALMVSKYCADQSGWACNELGILVASGRAKEQHDAAQIFERSCAAGFISGCANGRTLEAEGRDFRHGDPQLRDMALMINKGKGRQPELTPFRIYNLACEQGWMVGCGELAGLYFMGKGTPADKARAATLLSKACEGGHALSCSNLGLMHKKGDGVSQDETKALDYLKKACNLGLEGACRLHAGQTR